VGALGHFLEAAGVATTSISLIREQTETMAPPRALWVPFILGRPFGVPGDAAFQRRVTLAALALLEAPAGPVLADYPEDAPAPKPEDMEGIACPVTFKSTDPPGDLGAALLREIEEIAPWYDLARERRGRTTVGVSGLSVEDAARRIGAHLSGKPMANIEGYNQGATLKLAVEEVRAYYSEAAAARPGSAGAEEILQWFWNATAAGRAFVALQKACLAGTDESARTFASRSLVPGAVQRTLR
jgi:hypothetical protein